MLRVIPDKFVLLDRCIGGCELALLCSEECVLIPEELLELYQSVTSGSIKFDRLAGVEFEALDDVEDDAVTLQALNRNLLEPQE